MKEKLNAKYLIISDVISLIIFVLVYIFLGDAISMWQLILGWFILSFIIIWIFAVIFKRIERKDSKDSQS